jgi:hypothetical protein
MLKPHHELVTDSDSYYPPRYHLERSANKLVGDSCVFLIGKAMSALPLGMYQFLADAALFAGTAGVVWAMSGGGFDAKSNAGRSEKRIRKDRAQKLIPCDLCSGKGKKACQFWFASHLILRLLYLAPFFCSGLWSSLASFDRVSIRSTLHCVVV